MPIFHVELRDLGRVFQRKDVDAKTPFAAAKISLAGWMERGDRISAGPGSNYYIASSSGDIDIYATVTREGDPQDISARMTAGQFTYTHHGHSVREKSLGKGKLEVECTSCSNGTFIVEENGERY
jgi:hypothetical protein